MNIQFKHSEDWVEMYIDGKLVLFNHSLEPELIVKEIIKATNAKIKLLPSIWED